MATSTNIGPIISPDIASKISTSNPISGLGSQLPNLAKQKIVSASQGLTGTLGKAINELVLRQKQALANRVKILAKLERDFKNKRITEDEYIRVRDNVNASYDSLNNIIEKDKERLKSSVTNETKNIEKKVKDEINKFKKSLNKLRIAAIKDEVKAKKDLAFQILKNPANLLSIYPGLSLLITNAFLGFISQRKRLEKQVDAVNLYIDTKVVDEATVIIATNLKNDTIKNINNSIAKLEAIAKIIKTINTALKVAQLALLVLSLIPVPVPMPVLKVFEKLNKIISGISSILTVCLTILNNEIARLKELINRLRQIIIKLNNKTLAILTDDQLLRLIQTFLPVGNVLFPTLTAQPLNGVTGAVNIGGRIVYLNTISPAPGSPGSLITSVTSSIAATTSSISNIPISSSVVTGSNGTTNGNGIGIVTTGGNGNGGTSVGTQGNISTTIGINSSNPAGIGIQTPSIRTEGILTTVNDIGLDNALVGDDPIISINLDDYALEGINENELNSLSELSDILTLEIAQNESSIPTGNQPVPSIQDQISLYKGFRFQIKEEQNPKFVVRGTIKRRYAVAINRQGVEVLKSEYSFTLDPNDLVDQLKLVIDRQKLQG